MIRATNPPLPHSPARRLTPHTLFALAVCLTALPLAAQTPPAPKPHPEPFSGCVMRSPTDHPPTDKDTLILSTATVCARLTGTLSANKLDGHEIDLMGILTPRDGKTAASLQVDSVVKVGKACSDLCSLFPPGKRGLGGEKPGKEGGTPGAVPTQPLGVGGEKPGKEGGTPGAVPTQPPGIQP